MSMAIQFDTLRFVERLKHAGVPEAHAKAEAEALAVALAESSSGVYATKDDVTSLKLDMVDVRSEIKLLKWMQATVLAGVLSLVIKTFFV
ncbi:DUF1640 domain-containing protein [Hydrogenophaga bisanensis]|jgi:LDH2 family malate/lactate/ureidoglycolate dehydrogenase|uniref:DUF1640 domain-containing protein n=1 Tax=Hydrogenophaga bisanensis TaxID=439611 RepID=A0ABW2RDX9_9BURK